MESLIEHPLTAATPLEKSILIFSDGAAALLGKGILILFDRAAPPLLMLSSISGHLFITGWAADVGLLTVIGGLTSWFFCN